MGQFGHQDGGHTQLHRQQHQPVHRHCAEEAQITSLASQIGRHREKVNIVHQRHQDGGGTFLLSLEPHLGFFKGMEALEKNMDIASMPSGSEGLFCIAHKALTDLLEKL